MWITNVIIKLTRMQMPVLSMALVCKYVSVHVWCEYFPLKLSTHLTENQSTIQFTFSQDAQTIKSDWIELIKWLISSSDYILWFLININCLELLKTLLIKCQYWLKVTEKSIIFCLATPKFRNCPKIWWIHIFNNTKLNAIWTTFLLFHF